MKHAGKILLAIIANSAGLWVAAHYISGFVVSGEPKSVFWVGAILVILNILVRPILKLILGPIIILTLGFGFFIVNALVLYFLDFLSNDLSIESISALSLGTVVMTIVNIIVHIGTKSES